MVSQYFFFFFFNIYIYIYYFFLIRVIYKALQIIIISVYMLAVQFCYSVTSEIDCQGSLVLCLYEIEAGDFANY